MDLGLISNSRARSDMEYRLFLGSDFIAGSMSKINVNVNVKYGTNEELCQSFCCLLPESLRNASGVRKGRRIRTVFGKLLVFTDSMAKLKIVDNILYLGRVIKMDLKSALHAFAWLILDFSVSF
jgi:hypothetical protein